MAHARTHPAPACQAELQLGQGDAACQLPDAGREEELVLRAVGGLAEAQVHLKGGPPIRQTAHGC